LIRKLLLRWGAVAGALALVLIIGAADPVSAGTFNPVLKITPSTTEPNSPIEIVADLDLPKGDVNFAGLVFFIPKEWGLVRGDKIPIGADVGTLTSQATLGLIGGACNSVLPVDFEMKNASIDITDTVSFDDTDDNETRDYAEDNNGDGNEDAIDKYPDFINRVFATDNLQPIRRSADIFTISGIPVLLQFLVFPPGTHINDDIDDDPELGYPTVTLLQNVGDPDQAPSPGAITDFCTPLVIENTTFGALENGMPLSVTPAPGTYSFNVIAAGQRDADEDGYENSFDTCPYETNIGDPRITYDGDLDGDGLDAQCDPNDDPETAGTRSDEDDDGYQNRQDNCPRINNGEDTTNQHDEDKDQIGDECDIDPAVADGELIYQQSALDIVIGGGGPGGLPSDEACTFEDDYICYREGDRPTDNTGNANSPTAKPSGSGDPTSTRTVNEDGGGSSAVIIIVAVVAALAVVGGGAAFMMRRKSP
jgi:hypothetical protein